MFKALLKKDFLEAFGAVLHGRGKQAQRQRVAFVAILVMAVVYGGGAGFGMWSMADIFFQQQLEEPYLIFAAFAVVLFMVIMGITPLLSNLLFSDDISLLMRLPISFREIVLSKVLFFAISFFPVAAVILGPSSVAFGLYGGRGPVYYVQVTAGILSLLVIVECLLLLISFLLMKPLMRLKRPKDILGYVGSAIGMIVFIVIQFFTHTAAESGGFTGQFMRMAESGFVMGQAFLPIGFYARSLLRQGLEGLGYTFALAGLAVLLVYIVSRWSAPLFYNAFMVAPAERKKVKHVTGWQGSTPPYWAIAKKDFREILGTPAFFTQMLMLGFVMPVVIGYFSIRREWGSIYPFVAMAWTDEGLTVMQTFGMAVIYGVIAGVFLNFFAQFDHYAFSREGKNMWQLLALPLSATDMVRGKYLVNLVTNVGTQALILLAVLVFLQAPAFVWVGVLVGYAAFSLSYGFVGIMVDGGGPKLDWKDPRQMGQNNFRLLLFMLLEMAISAALVAGLAYVLWQSTSGGIRLISHRIIPVAIGVLILLAMLWVIFRQTAVSIYRKHHVDYLD